MLRNLHFQEVRNVHVFPLFCNDFPARNSRAMQFHRTSVKCQTVGHTNTKLFFKSNEEKIQSRIIQIQLFLSSKKYRTKYSCFLVREQNKIRGGEAIFKHQCLIPHNLAQTYSSFAMTSSKIQINDIFDKLFKLIC